MTYDVCTNYMCIYIYIHLCEQWSTTISVVLSFEEWWMHCVESRICGSRVVCFIILLIFHFIAQAACCLYCFRVANTSYCRAVMTLLPTTMYVIVAPPFPVQLAIERYQRLPYCYFFHAASRAKTYCSKVYYIEETRICFNCTHTCMHASAFYQRHSLIDRLFTLYIYI